MSIGRFAWLDVARKLSREVQSLANNFLILQETSGGSMLEHVEVRSTFYDKIENKLFKDKKLSSVKKRCYRVMRERLFLVMREH